MEILAFDEMKMVFGGNADSVDSVESACNCWCFISSGGQQDVGTASGLTECTDICKQPPYAGMWKCS